MILHYTNETWKYISTSDQCYSRNTFISNRGYTKLWNILFQFMIFYFVFISTLGSVYGMAILDNTYTNDRKIVDSGLKGTNNFLHRLRYLDSFNHFPDKWKTSLLSRLKTSRSRQRRSSIDEGNILSNNPGPTVSEINSWPHQCWVTTPRLPNVPVIYECIPQIIKPAIVDLAHSTPSVVVVEPTGSEPGSTRHPNTTTRNPRNMNALLDVITQFEVPDDVTELRMWFQEIVSIEGSAFYKLDKLKVLNLQHNQISYLSIDAFHGLSRLRELDLSFNRIQTIPSLTFNYLNHLEVLILRHNEISYVQNSMFCGLSSILTLDLSYNAIEDIGPYALRHFRSSYTISIELGHNKLKVPKKGWLSRGPTNAESDPLCENTHHNSDNKKITFTKTDKSISPIVVNSSTDVSSNIEERSVDQVPRLEVSEEDPIVLQPVRILKATHNPWLCKCDTQLCLVQFLRMYKAIMTPEYVISADISDNDIFELFRYNELNITSGDLQPIRSDLSDNMTYESQHYFKWYFTMPCDVTGEFKGYDLGRLTSDQQNNIEKTCCKLIRNSKLSKTIMQRDKTFGKICKDENDDSEGQLTENHVTVIGIVIVFCTPILLTLCPDCNRTVVPSSGGGMVAGGKFGGGALSSNNNNNNKPRQSGIWSRNDRKPFNNERFCLVVQQVEKKAHRSFFVEEEVV